MVWTKSYETGNSIVDKEHKEIFALVSKVLDNAFANRKEKINASIDFLTKYVFEHFSNEERLMNESDYPETEEHKKQHSDFTQSIGKLKEKIKIEGDTMEIGIEVNETIVDWLIEHVLGSDKKLANYYKQWQNAIKS